MTYKDIAKKLYVAYVSDEALSDDELARIELLLFDEDLDLEIEMLLCDWCGWEVDYTDVIYSEGEIVCNWCANGGSR